MKLFYRRRWQRRKIKAFIFAVLVANIGQVGCYPGGYFLQANAWKASQVRTR
jgi:hypothetical protein